MKNELQQQLEKKYPELCQTADSRYPYPMFGVECGDGWFNIIDCLCSTIQSHVQNRNRSRILAIEYNNILEEASQGNWHAFDQYYNWKSPEKLLEFKQTVNLGERRKVEEPLDVKILQIKEKFGTLRFYIAGGDDYIYGAIHLAESLSARVCEECGKPGQLRVRGSNWLYTACDEHSGPDDRVYADVIKENKF